MLDTNPIQYTSRDYDSITADINSDTNLKDKPNWFKRLIAGVGDVISMWLNACVNDLYLRTSFTRQSVKDLCELIAYTLSPQSTSNGIAVFYIDTSLGTGIFPFTVAASNLIGKSQGSLTLSSKTYGARSGINFTLIQDTFTTNYAVNNNLTVSTDFEYTGHKVRVSSTTTLPSGLTSNIDYYVIYKSSTIIALSNSLANAYAGNEVILVSNGIGTHTVTLYSKAVTLYQQDTLTNSVSIGKSDGMTEWQEFILPDKYILGDTLTVTINSISWTLVVDFTDSVSTSKHFKLVPLSDNQFSIRFGNGIYGMLPPANFDINVLYSYGGGVNSNLTTLNSINVYSGNDSNITGISNVTIFTGGENEESINNAKNVAPLQLKILDRFITVVDGETLALQYGGLSNVNIERLVYGALSCRVVGVATGGGNPSSVLRSAIQQYLIDRTVLQSIDVRFEEAILIPVDVTSAMKVQTGYTYANLLPYFRLAFKLITTETGREIYDDYINNGIESTITLINTLLTETFTVSDYTQIQRFLDNFEYRNFGDIIQESSVISFIDSFLIGCDYLTISTFGSGFPITLAENEITTIGTLTLSEIT